MILKTKLIISGIIAIHILICSCNQTIEKPLFTEVSQEVGIDFKYTFGDTTYENILESSGGGVTVLDYDGDQDMDVYLMNGTYLKGISDPEGVIFENASNKLYRNNNDGSFTEVSEKAGVDDRHWSMAAGAFDYEGDGDTDLYLLNYGPNVFYLNNGDGTFSNITEKLNLEGPDSLNGYPKWSVSVSYWDYNQDGTGDLMVGNFLAFDPTYISASAPDMMPHPAEYKGQASMFYQQEANGSFRDITKELKLFYPDSKCMGLTVFDYDDDGDMDIFQSNDHQQNFLFKNNGNQKYEEIGVETGVVVNDNGDPTGSMHASVGDIDGDGILDILVTDLKYGALYRGLGDGLFEDITRKSGIAKAFEGKGEWAACLFDYDNDGDLDVFSANGTAEELILQFPLLLENDGSGIFIDIGAESGSYFQEKRSGRGATVWDYDNDGDLDIIVSHVDLKARASLLRNDGGNRNHWLGLSLIGARGPASAVGAKVTIQSGELTQVLINQTAASYLSYKDPRLHVGLGKYAKVDQIEIRWSKDNVEVYTDITADQYIIIKEGNGIQE